MLCALIMAGGKGTRFWPLSTEEKPKQFLNLVGEKTMIQMTVDRITPIIPLERIFVCTGERYVNLVKEQLPELPEKNIIIEPEGRNTAPCITLSALVIKRYYKDATMVVLPSDHLIEKEDAFINIIKKSTEFLNDYKNSIITLGMTPNRAETGYGYIEVGNDEVSSSDFTISNVSRFVEKPNKEKAEEYLQAGNFLWNGGMFMWKVESILEKIKEYMPKTYNALIGLEEVSEIELKKFVNENYHKTDAISVDYGLLEKSEEIFVVPSNIGWDDVGSWDAIERYMDKDSNGNIIIGNVKGKKARDNILISSSSKIVIDNLSDIYVIESNGSVIIGRKEKINRVKELRNE